MMTLKPGLLAAMLLLATGCSSMPVPGMPKIDIIPDGDVPDRFVMSAEARAQTRARDADGSWTIDDPVRQSDYWAEFAQNCVSSGGAMACADQAPIETPGGGPATGRVAIAFASLPDGSRCTGEARQGPGRADESMLIVRGFRGAGGVVPRARSLARMTGSGDALVWDQIADARQFLAVCLGMKG